MWLLSCFGMLDGVVKEILTDMTLSRDLKDLGKRTPVSRKASAAKGSVTRTSDLKQKSKQGSWSRM